MSHFKYEINENHLRLQLRENYVSCDEDAWRKFESFSASQKNNSHDSGIKKFNISLNRNVVLPAVFGIVIIFFSLLLFNFVNIKNPKQETADVQMAEPTVSESAIEKKVEPSPQKKEILTEKDSIVAPIQEAAETTPAHNLSPLPPEVEAETTPALAKEVNSYENSKPIESATTQVNDQVTKKIETPRKKRIKRQLIVIEPTLGEDELAPPPLSQTSSSTSE